MKKIFSIIFLTVLASLFFVIHPAKAALTDWNINDFQSEIVVNNDSSLTITEKITADCDNLPDKHGIFRILPTQYVMESGKKVTTPVTLISITDFDNNPIQYQTTRSTNSGIKTITWKIGDPGKTVTGVNYYKITYKVENAIRHDNSAFDEFYWNLNGNFWEINTDNFTADIKFPEQITAENSKINIYSGAFREKYAKKVTDSWTSPSTLEVKSGEMLAPGEGITASITFPKNIIAPYIPSFSQKYGGYFVFIIPILVFAVCYRLWSKYGKDKKINSAVAPEFEIPENLTPLSMGMITTTGSMDTKFISAQIVALAVKKVLTIKQIKDKSILAQADYLLTLQKYDPKKLADEENFLIEELFGGSDEIKLSDLKNSFYQKLPGIKNQVFDKLVSDSYLLSQGITIKTIMFPIGIIIISVINLVLLPKIFPDYSLTITVIAEAISIFTISIFSIFMPKRTDKGAFLEHRIKGFKLYMDTAEKYRQQFNEKENIFEKFLPYAIMFGMTKQWIKKMQQIYGANYFASYHPIWFYGVWGSNFNIDAFTSDLNSLTSQMSSTMASSPSSSGSGGGGFSGGGGGGGGGGGW